MYGALWAVAVTSLSVGVSAIEHDPGNAIPIIRGAGMCAMYGNCGKKSLFGGELPCLANVPAQPINNTAVITTLASICGEELAEGALCCNESQIDELAADLRRAEPIIASCPACKKNFFDVFCQFTCSPDQSLFIEPLALTTTQDGLSAISELNYWLDPDLAQRIYDSCGDVKFSATNGRAMDLVGGGATNRDDFFSFLGDEKPMGSPFQINFPWTDPGKDISPQNNSLGYSCIAGESSYGCSCVDCPSSCPQLEPLNPPTRCKIGPFYCVSLGLLSGYLFCIGVASIVWVRLKYNRYNSTLEIQRLIHDDEIDASGDDPFAVPSAGASALIIPYRVNSFLQLYFSRSAGFCARFPKVVITLCTLFVLVCFLGLFNAVLETDPLKLWVSPKSLALEHKQIYDEQFGPFYRTVQIYAVNDTGPILSDYETLEWWSSVEDRISEVQTQILRDRLDNFCYKPLGRDSGCVVESVNQYFTRERPTPKNWKSQIAQCVKSPVRCMPKFQQPIDPKLVFGVYNSSVFDSRALVATWVLNNDPDVIFQSRVEQWEEEVENFLTKIISSEAKEKGIRISYSVESSLQRELTRASYADVSVVVASYLMMFIYVALALGKGKSKFWLGLFGILVVLLSVLAAVGLCSLLGVRLSLVTTEVIPFLALAIGVDNIFLLVHQIELISRLSPHLSIDDKISKAAGIIGPSILLSTTCEVATLMIGTTVKMPALRNFAIVAVVTIIINSTLQLSMFVAATALHLHKSSVKLRSDENNAFSPVLAERARNNVGDSLDQGSYQGDPRRFSFLFTSEYTPALLRSGTKRTIMVVFMIWLAVSLTLLGQIERGLDQRLAIPKDSFLIPYYTDMSEYLGVGPPVYFVVEHPGVEFRVNQEQLCSRFSTCDTESLPTILEEERKRPDVSYLYGSPASWLDDFFQWLNPDLDRCCIENGNVCYEGKDWDYSMGSLPQGENFTHYLNLWLDASNSLECPLAGKAPYANSVYQRRSKVEAVNFRMSHVPLRTQADYINAYSSALNIVSGIERRTGLNLFAYSVFYPYFAQYRTIVWDTATLVGSAIMLVLPISAFLLGSVKTAMAVTGVVAIMIINILGLMVTLGISLNALSLVNLIICVGLGVEFCIHIARSFTFVPRVSPLGVRGVTRAERAYNALAGTGGSVFGGIAVTKLIGVLVLAFAHSKIFIIYYFYMWLALVFCASLHALALLPVILSFWGGKAWLLEDFFEAETFADLEEL